MPKLIKLNSVENDSWSVVTAETDFSADVAENSLVSVAHYQAQSEQFKDKNIGVFVASDEDVLDLEPLLSALPVVAFQFDAFMDGRSFSQARILREHLDYKGEVRAIGSFIQDQLFYLQRCGFSEFSVADDANIESMQESLRDFSDSYQAGCDIPQPLFRRRA